MGTVLLRNVNPLGQVDLPLVGRQEDESGSTLGVHGVGCLEPGEVFEVDEDLAGRAPSTTIDDDGVEHHDPGTGLLAQVGNYELVEG
jgi:hypothetical protein